MALSLISTERYIEYWQTRIWIVCCGTTATYVANYQPAPGASQVWGICLDRWELLDDVWLKVKGYNYPATNLPLEYFDPSLQIASFAFITTSIVFQNRDRMVPPPRNLIHIIPLLSPRPRNIRPTHTPGRRPGGTLLVPFAIDGGHIGTTQYCINTAVKPFASAAIAISSINDALVLVAVSWRIAKSMTSEETFRGRVNVPLGRRGLPVLSRAVLQSGQQYYLPLTLANITVGSNILTLVMILLPTAPPVYHAMVWCAECRVDEFYGVSGLIAKGPLPTSLKRGRTDSNEGFQIHMEPIDHIEIAKTAESHVYDSARVPGVMQ
ncbi:hypothetical protein BD779DRAFT_1468093 [Infundibulicybe gibba]|nr:hypothetical protein BD779DRAFT_1468093 [Infundibulicybe gibba]